MNTENFTRHLRVLMRANRLIGEIRLRHLLAKSGANAFAGIIGAFGLLMLGLAGFFALEQLWGPIIAALVVGLANLLLAAVLVLWARGLQPSRDIELATELHKAALDGLVAEAQSVTRAIRNPMDSALPGLLLPLAGSLLGALRRRGKAGKAKPGE